jgi:Zn-finger nucleic acid-binding protein
MSACPKCKSIELSAPDPRASRLLRCPSCHGTWLPKDEARLEAVGALLSNDSTIRPAQGGDSRTGLCPEGHGILIRARVDIADPFHLERCAECQGIWFDKGEWNALARGHLLADLDHLWDPAWRQRARARRAEVGFADGLKSNLGRPIFESIETLATALRDHPPAIRREAIAHLEALLDHQE